MKEKIKKSYNLIKLSNSQENKIINKIMYKENKRNLKLSYVVVAILFVFLSVTLVYAKDINDLIKKWGGVNRTYKNNVTITEEEKYSIPTKIDDMVLEDNKRYDTWMTISEAKEYLGVDILTINETRAAKDSEVILFNYIAESDGKVQVIKVRQVDFVNEEVSLWATFITKNFLSEFVESFNQDTGVSYDSLEFIEKIRLDYLDVDAIIYSDGLWEIENDKEEKIKDLYTIAFTYKNINYELKGFENTTKEELIDIAKRLR